LTKRPFTKRELKSDLEIYTLSKLDKNPDTSDISLVLRTKKQRIEGT